MNDYDYYDYSNDCECDQDWYDWDDEYLNDLNEALDLIAAARALMERGAPSARIMELLSDASIRVAQVKEAF